MKNLAIAAAVAVVIGVAAFTAGWFIKGAQDYTLPAQSLRLGGYQFINPLLVCNINNSNIYTENTLLGKEIQSIIDTHMNGGDISKASVYFTDLKTGAWASVYPDAQFYPSSLGKIPILIAYYQESEN